MVDIQSRRELAQHLQAQMAASSGPWPAADSEDGDNESGSNWLKTYLLEAHCERDRVLDSLRDLGTAGRFETHGTRDPDLIRLTNDDAEFWCDTSLGRFWRMHTVAPVKPADDFRAALVAGASWLDNVWLPPDYLEQLPSKVGAHLQTFSLHHDRRPLTREAGNGRDLSITMRLWSSRAAETLDQLRSANVFPHAISLRSVKLRSGSEEPDGDYCVAEYFHNGKVTANGTSFDRHNDLVMIALRDYRKLVESIEERFWMGASTTDHEHCIVTGNPIVIDVEWSVEDLEYAVGRMFASSETFRLWALPERLSATHYRARAVDLHFGGVLTFDITPETVVIQLPRGVCGNTVVRFLNNLRFHVNSDAALPAGTDLAS